MSANKTLVTSTLVIILLTLLAKPFGIFKEIYVASQFGTGKELDAFYIAFTIPTFIAGIMSSSVRGTFVPVYLDYRTKSRIEDANILFSSILNLHILVLLPLTLLILLLSEILIELTAPGFGLMTRQLSTNLSIILFPILFFGTINNLLSSLINAHKRFVATTLVPILLPVSMIFFLYFGKHYGIYSLALGNIAGLIFMGIALIFVVRNTGFHYTITIQYDHPALKKILKLTLPLLIGSLIGYANVVVDRIMASTLPTGSISSLGYADRIIIMLQSIIIMPVSTAALPYLSEQFSRGELEELKNTIILSVRFLAFLFIPITLGLVILAKPLVSLLFQRGQFGADATLLTSQALTFYSLGLYFMALNFVFSRVFNAIQKTKINMYAAMLCVVLNIVLNIYLMRYMGAAGIALSTSVVYFAVSVFLFYMILRNLGHFGLMSITKAILHIGTPAIFMTAACVGTVHFLEVQLPLEVAAVTAVGFFTYVALCYLLKVPELAQAMKLINNMSFQFAKENQSPK